MSLIARCPACATLFRVVPDQLKISDGWVRCGQCSEVFDATASLQAAPPAPVPQQADGVRGRQEGAGAAEVPAPAPVEVAEPEPEPRSEPQREPESRSESERPPTPALSAQSEGPVAVMDAPTLASEPPASEPPVMAAGDTQDAAQFPMAAREAEGDADPILEPGPLTDDATGPSLGRAAGEPGGDPALGPTPVLPPLAEPPLEDVSFVRDARRRAFWGSPGMRWTMGASCAALGLLLAGQVMFHHRDRLALQVPALQPALAALCASFQCRLGPPRRIESIAIESSAFTRVRADAFRLSLTLSNQADIPVATPALELTLTDLQDQPVLRRVLQPADLGPDAPQAIAARTEWTSTLTLAIAPAANPARVVGYRVLAFYP